MATTLRTYAYAGMAAPYAFEIDISPSADGTLPDLSVVTAASLALNDTPRGPLTWTAVIVGQTATLLRLQHVFAADGSDISVAGIYWVVPQLTTPSGVLWADPACLLVKALP